MPQRFVSVFGELGVLVVVGNVFLDKISLPLPAMPIPILAGGIGATDTMSVIDLFPNAAAGAHKPTHGRPRHLASKPAKVNGNESNSGRFQKLDARKVVSIARGRVGKPPVEVK